MSRIYNCVMCRDGTATSTQYPYCSCCGVKMHPTPAEADRSEFDDWKECELLATVHDTNRERNTQNRGMTRAAAKLLEVARAFCEKQHQITRVRTAYMDGADDLREHLENFVKGGK